MTAGSEVRLIVSVANPVFVEPDVHDRRALAGNIVRVRRVDQIIIPALGDRWVVK